MEQIQTIAQMLIIAIEREFNIKVKKIEIEQTEKTVLIGIEKE